MYNRAYLSTQGWIYLALELLLLVQVDLEVAAGLAVGRVVAAVAPPATLRVTLDALLVDPVAEGVGRAFVGAVAVVTEIPARVAEVDAGAVTRLAPLVAWLTHLNTYQHIENVKLSSTVVNKGRS